MICIVVGVLLTLSIVVFGIRSLDRIWQPRPDDNFLSWSYGCAVGAAAFALITAYLLLQQYWVEVGDKEIPAGPGAESLTMTRQPEKIPLGSMRSEKRSIDV
ncbi:uncharacterized protein LOC141909815 [Tubulanus polymorphus]|uniref:uncharacterized protein LOC141909815 n=1 Tax=Tubulanus polymorphus TaxID=672921 RepID=UPI003DA2AD57